MARLADTLAVQSYCYRGSPDNATVAALVKDCGLDALELCGAHIDFDDEAAFDAVIDTYTQASIKLISLGVESVGTDEPALRKRFNFARKVDATVISIAFPADATSANYRLAEKLCDEYDINGALHNHGSRHWQGSSDAIERLFDQTSSRIGLCLDTAWALDSREDPVALARQFAERLYSVHIKDFVFDRAAQPEDVIVGTGNLDLSAFQQALSDTGFTGPAIIEYEGDVDDPAPALIQCVEAVRNLPG